MRPDPEMEFRRVLQSKLRTSDFGLRTSDFRSGAPWGGGQNYGLRTSDFRGALRRTSDFGSLTSDFGLGLRILSFEPRTLEVLCGGLRTSDFGLRTSELDLLGGG